MRPPLPGFEAHAVYSGEGALEMAQVPKPNILISDVVMSGITGIETAIRACAMLPACKILLFSGQAATANLLENARAQGYEFEILIKRVRPADLLARIRTIVPEAASSLTSK